MSIAALTSLVVPPPVPLHGGDDAGWSQLESELGFHLPADYQRLVRTYGVGSWMGFLWVFSPFATNPHLNLRVQAPRQLEAECTIHTDFPDDGPFALHPEPDGLFPWALTDNGDRLYWLTQGPPSAWPTIIYESRGPQFERHPLSCTEFLFRWVSGELPVSVFPRDFDFGRSDSFVALAVGETDAV